MESERARTVAGSDADAAEVERLLDTFTVRITTGPAPTPDQQLLAHTLVNLLARLLPRLQLDVANEVLGDLERARQAGLVQPLEPGAVNFRVHVGTAGDQHDADLYLDAREWIGYIGSEPSQLQHAAHTAPPIGALASAARGAAHAIAAALAPVQQPRPLPRSVYADSLTYEVHGQAVAPRKLPALGALNHVLVGAGSVGGAAMYALSCVEGVSGHLDVVDPQCLEARNAARAILADAVSAREARPKAEVAAAALENHPLEVRSHQMSFEEFVAARPRNLPLPTVLCAVDSAASRRAVQDCMPLELINAACHPHEIAVSGHVTDQGPCVMCLQMPDEMNTEQARKRVLVRATGLDEAAVLRLLVNADELSGSELRRIEAHNELPEGKLERYRGKPLEQLYNEQLAYGANIVTVNDSTVHVAAAYVTALAGFVLAGEALKSTTDAHRVHRLGARGGIGTKFLEVPASSPEFAQLVTVDRWQTSECFCHSTRRLRLMRERYGAART